MSESFYGPDAELLAAWTKAGYVEPAAMPGTSHEAFEAMQTRVLGARTWTDLDAADRAWITEACAQVSAGRAPALTIGIGVDNIVTDFAAEDAAAEAGAVPPVIVLEPEDAPLTADDLDELATYDDVPTDGDIEGWVGV